MKQFLLNFSVGYINLFETMKTLRVELDHSRITLNFGSIPGPERETLQALDSRDTHIDLSMRKHIVRSHLDTIQSHTLSLVRRQSPGQRQWQLPNVS
jgi:hypothetical protein